jgi:hypothetical protein
VPENCAVTKAEQDIMRHFRQYHVGVNEMLFFNTASAQSNSPRFQLAMASLIRSGLVIRERRRHAYSLTDSGFVASLLA